MNSKVHNYYLLDLNKYAVLNNAIMWRSINQIQQSAVRNKIIFIVLKW